MYLVSLTYTAPLDEIDRHRDAHMEWIAEQYAAGRFVASGAKVPRTGGVILVKDLARDELDAVIAADPFSVAGVADYEVTEFRATSTVEELSAFREGV